MILERVWNVHKKSKVENYHKIGNTVSRYISRTIKSRYNCTPMFVAAFVTIAKRQKQPKCPLMGEWISNM